MLSALLALATGPSAVAATVASVARCGTAALLWLLMAAMPARAAAPAPAAAATAGGPAPGAALPGRVVLPLEEGWRFSRGDAPSAMQAGHDESRWRSVRVPHDWSMDEPFAPGHGSGNGHAAGGVGWYRLRLPDALAHGAAASPGRASSATSPAGPANRANSARAPATGPRRWAIEFDGVMDHAEVWLNGHRLGGRPNGYLPMRFELSRHLRADAPNVLALRVDRSRQTDSRWFTGSGIYRNVRLVGSDALQLAPQGVVVLTPEAGAARATVQVQTTVLNTDAAPRAAVLHTQLLAPDGRLLAQQRQPLRLAAGAQAVRGQRFTLALPARWSPATPQLHRLRSALLAADGGVIDQTETPFGIRSIRFTPDRGFELNGQALKLKGVALHHDAGSLGAAVPRSVLERRLLQLKALGVNAIRTSHNPPAPELLDLTDRLGLLVQVEALDEFTPAKNKWVEGWNVGLPSRHGAAEHFDDWALRDVQDMVRRDRHHPSVVMWSIGNEVDYPNDPFSHPVLGPRYRPHHPPAADLVRLARPLVAAVRALDPSRPVTAALASLPMSDAVGLPALLDVVGYNYQEARYAEDHARHPRRVIYGSENSHDYRAWAAVRDLPYISAQFLWTGFDYLGEAKAWPQRGADFGLFDLAGFLKPRGAFREALWSAQPVVHLAVAPVAALPAAATAATAGQGQGQPLLDAQRRGPMAQHWSWPAGTPMIVHAYANTPEVQLWLNGRLLGSQQAAQAVDGVLSWRLPHEPGELLAIGLAQGREMARQRLRSAGSATAVRLQLAHAGGDGVLQVVAEVVDAAGERVPDATHTLQFSLEGSVEILGIGNGQLADTEPPRDERHAVHEGRALAVLRRVVAPAGAAAVPASAPGLRVSAPGLQPAHLSF
ncbi:glycoside hydrolase family 2 TIM barrel-domain containing protein [Aquabacterium sp. OR-4]|uniref:glycoside hydrolase family 2 TIM barrel-domain containing protein n=1 Tax=Aquabacterium sp. OR-4 TaxID=2978127 RepID=UPI0028C54BB9|nr:glycoside hydrolase family 2 TIM barrel-domain containing protein [Aquabacterium sp. OR-4]MDT7838900.1 glycoside hydrolase family 2 TIM barrel-domain containing protein [Aquabacterium sp. OR-4]